MGWYTVLKVVHVLSVVVWIGGATAFAVAVARLIKARDFATMPGLLAQGMRYGQTMGGPAAGLVLLTGIAMVKVGGIGFRPLWVSLGFVGIVVHFLFGATVMRMRGAALGAALAAKDEPRILVAGRGARLANLVYLLLMTLVIVDMIAKPVG
jgi:hypothetical protein